MTLRQQTETDWKAWETAPACINWMGGKQMGPLLTLIESLCRNSRSAAGGKTIPITCKGTSWSNGSGYICTGHGRPRVRA